MRPYALFIQHQPHPGRRDDVEAIWRRHMLPAIAANEAHQAYFYCFAPEPDVICAFQCYTSEAHAKDFLDHPAYAAYLEEVTPLLQREPHVQVLDVRWAK